jgi:hypothetical protein
MTKHEIEAFVRKMLKDTFNQKADAETVRSVAAKLAKALPQASVKKQRQ